MCPGRQCAVIAEFLSIKSCTLSVRQQQHIVTSYILIKYCTAAGRLNDAVTFWQSVEHSSQYSNMLHCMIHRTVLRYAIQVTGGFEDGADVGPMISTQAKERAEELIQACY
jgi:hypothetical protein